MATLEQHLTHKPAQTEREWWALLKSGDKSIVRSIEDWHALVRSKENPLAGCDQKAVEAFTNSLRFSNGGLGHADYGNLKNQLTYAQFSNLWSRFGLGMTLFEDHDGYYCQGKGTCTTRNENICTSNC